MVERTFKQILEQAGYTTEAYSGRGMYGKTCLSVDTDKDLHEFFADMLETLGPEENGIAARAFRKMRTDNRGRDTVIYFPGIAP